MTKKFFFIFLLAYFLQFSFWPTLFGLAGTPAFLLAFLVVLSGKISLEKSWLWFVCGGILLGYFSSWPPLVEAFFLALINGVLFLMEKIFLWQRRNVWLEITLLMLIKLFFDGLQWLTARLFFRLGFLDWNYGQDFVFKNYLSGLVGFVLAGLFFYFLLRKEKGLSSGYDSRYYS